MELAYAAGIGGATAYTALRYYSLEPALMYRQMTPNAVSSVINNDLKGPKVMTNNEAYKFYEDSWSVQSMSGVRLWLQICKTIRDVGRIDIVTMKSWPAFYKFMKRAFPYIIISELTIPFVYAEGNTTKFRMMTLSEYIQHQGPHFTPFLFFCTIVEIALFGFCTDISTLSALRFESDMILNYMNKRLRGGKYDPFQ